MPRGRSAGLLMYRRSRGVLEVFLVHPGGPYWRNKDEGAWTVPKGEIAADELPVAAALREWTEETGLPAPAVQALRPLGSIRQKAGKEVTVWAFEGELPDGFVLRSSTFELEWPPRSGQTATFPEVDRAGFFDLEEATRRLLPAQVPLLERLAGWFERA